VWWGTVACTDCGVLTATQTAGAIVRGFSALKRCRLVAHGPLQQLNAAEVLQRCQMCCRGVARTPSLDFTPPGFCCHGQQLLNQLMMAFTSCHMTGLATPYANCMCSCCVTPAAPAAARSQH
jgi:hypothetical protein